MKLTKKFNLNKSFKLTIILTFLVFSMFPMNVISSESDVSITSPSNGASFYYGQSVTFSWQSPLSGTGKWVSYTIKDSSGVTKFSSSSEPIDGSVTKVITFSGTFSVSIKETYEECSGGGGPGIDPGLMSKNPRISIETCTINVRTLDTDTISFSTAQHPGIDILEVQLINGQNAKEIPRSTSYYYTNPMTKGAGLWIEVKYQYLAAVTGQHTIDFLFEIDGPSVYHRNIKDTIYFSSKAKDEVNTVTILFSSIITDTDSKIFALSPGTWTLQLKSTNIDYLGGISQSHSTSKRYFSIVSQDTSHIVDEFSDLDSSGSSYDEFSNWNQVHNSWITQVQSHSDEPSDADTYPTNTHRDYYAQFLKLGDSDGSASSDTGYMWRLVNDPENTGIIMIDISYTLREYGHIFFEGFSDTTMSNKIWSFALDDPHSYEYPTLKFKAWDENGVKILDYSLQDFDDEIGYEYVHNDVLRLKLDLTDPSKVKMSANPILITDEYNPFTNLIYKEVDGSILNTQSVRVGAKYYRDWVQYKPGLMVDNYVEGKFTNPYGYDIHSLPSTIFDAQDIDVLTPFEYSQSTNGGSFEHTALKIQNNEIIGYRTSGSGSSGWQSATVTSKINQYSSSQTKQLDIDVDWNFPSMGIVRIWGLDDLGNYAWRAEIYDPWAYSTPKRVLRVFNTDGTYDNYDTSSNTQSASGSTHLKVVFDDGSGYKKPKSISFLGTSIDVSNLSSRRSTSKIVMSYYTHTDWYGSGTYGKFRNYKETGMKFVAADVSFLLAIDDGVTDPDGDLTVSGTSLVSTISNRLSSYIDLPIILHTKTVTGNWVGVSGSGDISLTGTQLLNNLRAKAADFTGNDFSVNKHGFDKVFGITRRDRSGYVEMGLASGSAAFITGGSNWDHYNSNNQLYSVGQHEVSHLFGAPDYGADIPLNDPHVMNHDPQVGGNAGKKYYIPHTLPFFYT